MGAREHGRGARAGVVMPLEEQMVGACPATPVICQRRGFTQRGPGADYVLCPPPLLNRAREGKIYWNIFICTQIIPPALQNKSKRHPQ